MSQQNLGPYRTGSGKSPAVIAFADMIRGWRLFWNSIAVLYGILKSLESSPARLARYSCGVVLLVMAFQIGKAIFFTAAEDPRAEITELRQDLSFADRSFDREVSRRRAVEARLQAAYIFIDSETAICDELGVLFEELQADYDYEYLSRQLEDERHGLIPTGGDPLVMDVNEDICRTSELLSPERVCP